MCSLLAVESFTLPYFREAILEILLLAVPCGLIGSWVVLRGLAFHSHAVGTAAFPGLVLAEGLGFATILGALGAAIAFTLLSALISRSRRTNPDAVTALALAACLAAGVILASDVFGSGASVDTLLFGSLLAIGPADLWLALAATLAAAALTFTIGHHWLVRGFDPESARGLSSGSARYDVALLAVIGITVIAALGAVGALLVSTLIVVPAATARLFATRTGSLQLAAIGLAAGEGILGLWLSAVTDAPPGATIAVVSGAIFALALSIRGLARRGILRPVAGVAASTLLLGVLAGLGTGCDDDRSKGDDLRVVATTTQVGDLVREVGGDRISLTILLKPNTDPHEYEPRPSDVEAVAEADVIFRSGGDLDRWTGGLIEDSGSKAGVVDLSHGLPAVREDEDGGLDPHWWHDPVNVESATSRIEATLTDLDPGRDAWFRRRARRFDNQIRSLTTRIEECLRPIPLADRKIVTDHDSFGYFTDRFRVTSIGSVMPALTRSAQPSAGDLADLESLIRRERVQAIFPEKSLSPALAGALARETGATVGNPLFGDTLGPAGSPGATWLGSMRANANAITEGLTGGRRNCFGSGQ